MNITTYQPLRSLTLRLLIFIFILSSCATSSAQLTAQPSGATQPNATADQATYYVAPNGADTNPGTLAKPFGTLAFGVAKLQAGDTLYIRAGSYNEFIAVKASGTAERPITIAAYPRERPIIDGEYRLPQGGLARTDPQTGGTSVYEPLVSIEGSYIVVRGLEVTHSQGRGIRLWPGDHNTVQDTWIHDNYEEGLLIQGRDNKTFSEGHRIQNNRLWQNASLAAYDRPTKALDWPGGLSVMKARDVLIEGNTVFNNWGEGVLLGGTDQVTVRGNVVYDNFAAQIYSERSSTIMIAANLVYHTGDDTFLRGGNPSPCVGFSDEEQFASTLQRGSNQVVINNLIAGCSQNLFFWSGLPDSGLKHALIANNTLLNATVKQTGQQAVGIEIMVGAHEDVRVVNNIIVQDSGKAIETVSSAAITFDYNLMSRLPDGFHQGANDMIADPELLGSAHLSPGKVSPDIFLLSEDSPARGKALALPEVTHDFSGFPRSEKPDLGGLQYRSGTGGADLSLIHRNPHPGGLVRSLRCPGSAPDCSQVRVALHAEARELAEHGGD